MSGELRDKDIPGQTGDSGIDAIKPDDGPDTHSVSQQGPTENQRRASHPGTSVWVSAQAGTGKTTVLTNRVLSLMLAGNDPQRILCLTFTRAAAAEMDNRIKSVLEQWVSADEAELHAMLERLTGQAPDAKTCVRARRMFARVLDVPGGMKIQTIHAFCESLLGRFPLEAGLPPHFRLLDERLTTDLLSLAKQQVLQQASEPGNELAGQLSSIIAHVHDFNFDTLLREVAKRWPQLRRRLSQGLGMPEIEAQLYSFFDLDPGLGEPDILSHGVMEENFAGEDLRFLAGCMLEKGSSTVQKNGQKLADWLASDISSREAAFEDYVKIFLTKERQPRKNILTKSVTDTVPHCRDIAAQESQRLQETLSRLYAYRVVQQTLTFLHVALAVLKSFDRLKRREQAVDFDDLIQFALGLLSTREDCAWVLFKLDGGIDHILIDEAQDTSPDQWEVIRLVSEEFFSGLGREVSAQSDAQIGSRTIFAVGDPKQSIYSFQQADPRAFLAMRSFFESRLKGARQNWAALSLTRSFRSTPAILACVDLVFADPKMTRRVTLEDHWDVHEPTRLGEHGVVEVWPITKNPTAGEWHGWDLPLPSDSGKHARSQLVHLIADKIKAWLMAPDVGPGDEAWLAAKGRRIEAGDILILVRKRRGFVEELVRRLKELDIPVAGADRLKVAAHLAVRDLIALGRVTLLPEDDLSLATVLKGPLLNFSEEDIFDLLYGRKDSLWASLYSKKGEKSHYREAYDYIAHLLRRADFTPPFEFYSDVLAQGGKKQILARLGPDAREPMEEFLSQAVAYEALYPPSLEGFLHWFEVGDIEIKRDLEVSAQAVRIMTVHGAKGLQAPVVFLPDTVGTPTLREKVFWLDDGAPLISFSAEKSPARLAEVRKKQSALQLEEYDRLLYVALTRAEDRLYIAGWQISNHRPNPESWYECIQSLIRKDPRTQEIEFDLYSDEVALQGQGLRLESPQEKDVPKKPAEIQGRAQQLSFTMPDWVGKKPLAESGLKPLAPSQNDEEAPPMRSPLGLDLDPLRFQRGRLIHALLQYLPDLPLEARPRAAGTFLAHPQYRLSAPDQALILKEVTTVLHDRRFAEVFTATSRAEVPLVGLVATKDGKEVISGQVDRLVVTNDKVIIVDYKTNRPPPKSVERISRVYLRQMAAYSQVLEGIFPDKSITAALLWTDGPLWMPIPRDLLAPYMA